MLEHLRQEPISRDNLQKSFCSVMSNAAYGNINDLSIQSSAVHATFNSDEDFWRFAKSNAFREGLLLKLESFNILEWLPFSPGLYFERYAVESRGQARQFFDEREKLFSTDGKSLMVKGGIGSLRINSRKIDGQTHYFLGVTSSGQSHEGIPVIMNADHYNRYINEIIENGAVNADIYGEVKFLTEKVFRLNFGSVSKRFVINITDIKNVRLSNPDDISVSVATSFYPRALNEQYWTFCLFNPNYINRNMSSQIDWMKNYIYKNTPHRTSVNILNDFDEQYDHFTSEFDVDFKISQLINQEFPIEQINKYSNRLKIDLNVEKLVVHGDYFNNISNSLIINRSVVSDLSNKVFSRFRFDTFEGFDKLLGFVIAQDSATANELIQSMTDFLDKKLHPILFLKKWEQWVTRIPALDNQYYKSTFIAIVADKMGAETLSQLFQCYKKIQLLGIVRNDNDIAKWLVNVYEENNSIKQVKHLAKLLQKMNPADKDVFKTEFLAIINRSLNENLGDIELSFIKLCAPLLPGQFTYDFITKNLPLINLSFLPAHIANAVLELSLQIVIPGRELYFFLLKLKTLGTKEDKTSAHEFLNNMFNDLEKFQLSKKNILPLYAYVNDFPRS